MEGVVLSVVTGAMRTLLPKLGSLLEDKLSKGLKKDITSLRNEMKSMDALLLKLSGIEQLDAQDKDWRDKVRELSYDVEDCIDIYMNNLDRKGLFNGFRALKAPYKIKNRIQELNARIVEVSNCHNRYKFGACSSQPSEPSIVEALYEDPFRFVGIDGPRDNIIEWLMEEQEVQQLWPCLKYLNFARFLQKCYSYIQNFFRTTVKSIPSKPTKVLSIVGSRGMGKTTLSRQVYNKIKSQYDCTAFVSVSQNPDTIKILSDILLGLKAPPPSCTDQDGLIESLMSHLQGKRYLIVIDDVWNSKTWDNIRFSFVDNNRSSRVITTTCIEDVAKQCCSRSIDRVYKIKPLNDLDSRRLFNRRIFNSQDGCPKEQNKFTERTLEKCGGMPLAILCVASVLSNHEEQSWEKIHDYLSFQFERNPDVERMLLVLNLGYNDLSLDLRTCMLYLGIFPENSEIMKVDLMRRWIAEGFVSDEYTCGAEDVAERYFNQLINRSMIQIAEFDDCGKVVSCRVHGLMLEFIISKCKEENFITIINDYPRSMKHTLTVRRISVQVRKSEDDDVLANMELVQARSLNFWGPFQLVPSLSSFLHLRVLHVDVYGSEHCEQYDLSWVRKFFQLRYLRIKGIKCKTPLKLHKLKHLKTLEIIGGETKGYLKMDVRKLPSMLWHLIVSSNVKLLGGIRRMSSLRTLYELRIDLEDLECIKELGDLSNLRELKLVPLPHKGVALGACDVLVSSLSKLGSLHSLTIHGSLNVDVLTKWSPPPCHLHRLHVLGCPFSTPLDWITQLGNLRSLELEVLSLERNGADILDRLTSLVHLRLDVTNQAPEEGILIPGKTFQNLKDFVFRYEVPCIRFEAGAMPVLQSLKIECCVEAKRQGDGVLDGIEHLGSLNAFEVRIYPISDFRPVQYYYILQSGHSTLSLGEEEQKELKTWDASYSPPPHTTEEPQTWDMHSLEAALRKAINRHQGRPVICIQYM